MTTTEATMTLMIEAYGSRFGQHVRIAEIAELTGLTREEMLPAVLLLMDEPDFEAEPHFHAGRITPGDRAAELMIGGEARHYIRWAA